MADGVPYPDIQRPNYFNSQLLYESDFKDEQAYHRAMRLLHNRSLHTWGIVQGLDVQKGADNKSITVSRGMAIDNQGREIVLAKDATPKDWPQLQLNQTKDVYVTIRYYSKPDENTKLPDILGGGVAYRREKEIPTIEIADASPAPDGTAIVLAKIKLDPAGVITDIDKTPPTRSRAAGSVVYAATELTVRNLLVEGKVGIGAPSPGAKLEVANHALDDTAFQPLIRLLANQQDESSSNVFDESKPSYGIEFYRRWSSAINIQAGIYAWGTGNLGSGLAFRTKPSEGRGPRLHTRMVITDGGNIGIGTTAPKSTLSVKGGLAVGTTYAGTNAAADNCLLVEGRVRIGTGNRVSDAKLAIGGDSAETGFGQGTHWLQLRNDKRDTKDAKWGIAWDGGDPVNTPTAFILANFDEANTYPTSLTFGTRNRDGKTAERMRVRSDGNVGIGTTDPGTARLKVDGTLNVTGASTLTGGVTIPDPSSLSFGNTPRQMINLWNTNFGIGIQDSTQYFRTDMNFAWYKGGTHNGGQLVAGGGTVQMVIKGGNVGIGTASPGSKLEVGGTLTASNDNEALVALKIASTFQDGGKTGVKHYGLIVADGNVGIGTTDPKSTLSVKGGLAVGATYAGTHAAADNCLLVEGNVGIGTTSPGAKLSFINVNEPNAGTAGITWNNPTPTQYGIHRTDGTWTSPDYQQLRLAWDTGIVLYPGTAFGKSYVDIQGGGLRVTAGDLKVFGGEIIGKIKTSEEFEWVKNKAPVKMWPSATSVAFLTCIAGAFNGWGEKVEIVDKDGFWWLQGEVGSGALAARARCIGAPPK